MKQTPRFVLLFILFLTFWLILGINPVYAQEPTPSATWQPLFPSPTARPTINDICPDYQPIGWQTVTPSPRWLMNCSQCIVRSTADWSGFEVTPFPVEYVSHLGYCTIEEEQDGCYSEYVSGGIGCICLGNPTATPSFEVTSTPLPIGIYIEELYNYGTFSHTYVNAAGLKTVGVVNNHVTGNCGSNQWLGYIVKYNVNLEYNPQNFGLTEITGGDLQLGGGTYSKEIALCQTSFYTTTLGGVLVDRSVVCDTAANLLMGVGSSKNIVNEGSVTWQTRSDYKTSFNGFYKFYPICYGQPPAPTPQPTLDTGSDYCNEVEPEYLMDKIGLELPTPRFGEGQCIVVGGWSIGLGWLESIFPNLFQFNVPESFGVPGFNLCLHPFTFGYINLFGILLDMDVLFLLVSYIMVVRWLLRS
jgi:hypothetical protein